MESKRNVLILKGDLWAGYVLDLLDSLLEKVREQNNLKEAPKPWQLFSLICASGAASLLAVLLGPGQKTTNECRGFLRLLLGKCSSLRDVPSSNKAWNDLLSVMKDLTELDGEPSLTEDRCEVFIWNFYRSHEAQNHVASYENNKRRDVTMLKLLLESLCVQEYPHFEDPDKELKYPFDGLFNHAQTSAEHHNSDICISIRDPARYAGEAKAALEVSSNMIFSHHIAFVFDVLYSNHELNKKELEKAATTLAEWYKKTEAESSAEKKNMF